jgi:hydrogenase maturation protease
VNLQQVEKIAEAVLYEGYMLYPYRISSIKNRQRFNFGVLYPEAYCDRQLGSEASAMQTECLLRTTPDTRLTVKVRFLQIVRRSVGRVRPPGSELQQGVEPEFELVDRLEFAGRVHQPWQEAFERELSYTALDPASLSSRPIMTFTFPEQRSVDYLRDEQGLARGVTVRDWEELNGSVRLSSESLRDGIVKATVRVDNRNLTDTYCPSVLADREAILPFSLASAHTILGVDNGEFLSLLDPPENVKDLVAQCSNVGTWPVLAGERGEAVLSSPIILYDYPQIAPESAGNLFDSTEIDEILSLRIMTLTEDEKREVRQSDDRAREILERTENMPEEQLMKLHGVLRGLAPHVEDTR